MTDARAEVPDWPQGVEADAEGRPVIVAAWLREPHLQRLIEHLGTGAVDGGGDDGDGTLERDRNRRGSTHVVGGAVRNTLLGVPVKDVDIATARRPEGVVRIAERLGYKPVPTGIEHGTVTVVTPAGPYEVTTFRADVDTDGRHARVAFTDDMRLDAERRDFTINALYADADGAIHDVIGGLSDLASRTVRFIGSADGRIAEDYLRILRFFRFQAHYGRGRPETDGLKACARHKDGLDRLSPERVWSELRRLLEAPEPGMTLLWMRQTGVLTAVLPESGKWGIDAIPGLVAAERDLGWTPDPMLRLMAMVPPDAERMAALARRLRMSGAEADRLALWAATAPPGPALSEAALRERLYREGRGGLEDHLRLALASARARAVEGTDGLAEAGGHARLLGIAETWQPPAFPLKGRDLIERGATPGPDLGERLKALEERWIGSGFVLGRDELLNE